MVWNVAETTAGEIGYLYLVFLFLLYNFIYGLLHIIFILRCCKFAGLRRNENIRWSARCSVCQRSWVRTRMNESGKCPKSSSAASASTSTSPFIFCIYSII